MKKFSKAELERRKNDAKDLQNHYLLKEFFAEIEKYCYDNILNVTPDTDKNLKHFALLAQATAMLKGKLERCATLTIEHERKIKEVQNIHE